MQSKILERSSKTAPNILFLSSCIFHSSIKRIKICWLLHSSLHDPSKICKNSLACLVNWSNIDDSIIFEKVFRTLTGSVVCVNMLISTILISRCNWGFFGQVREKAGVDDVCKRLYKKTTTSFNQLRWYLIFSHDLVYVNTFY